MPRSSSGFTLVELLVVLLILSLLLVAAPIAFDRALPGLQVRSDAREVVRILREARGLAIAEYRESTVTIDVSERYFQLDDNEPRISFSEGSKITLEAASIEQINPDAARIRFFPSGASTGGRVTLDHRGKSTRIEVDWLYGRVRIIE